MNDTWRTVKIREVLEQRVERGKNGDTLLSVTAKRGVIRHSESGRRDTSNPDKSKYLRVHSGDVVYNTMRMWQGVSAVSSLDGIVSPAYTVCLPTAAADSRFLGHMLKLPKYVVEFKKRSQGLVSDTWNLKYSEFSRIPVSIPPVREQKYIADLLDTLDTQIAATHQIISKLRSVREGLARNALRVGARDDWLPSDWPLIELGSILKNIDAGKSPDCPNIPASAGNWGVLKVSAVGADGFLEYENKSIPSGISIPFSAEVREGDVLVTRANTPELVGMACIVQNRPTARLLLSDKTWRINTDTTMNPAFLVEALRSAPIRRFMQIEATGTSGSMKNISKGAIRKARIPLPSLSEQERIVSILKAQRAREDAEQRFLAGLETLKQGLMSDLLTGRVRVPVEAAS
ncbi:restriction endonuclease subunit S [Rhodococcus opacus]|uniref:restriction endonuclease subunit S n=1 Tax=Rhodococcus opacus TaxID=37919 RepID=UPI001FF15257|nr:restriction endonuclease subunit S [Rhodococcus opacus]UOT06783.1 restriction endonuclease subunit S [Rhodococcus opacus]